MRAFFTLVVTSLALLASTGMAVSSTLDVHADYLDNGVIDRAHSHEDLRAALEAAAGDAQYAGLAAAITDALEHDLLGRRAGAPVPVTQVSATPESSGGLGVLPVPQAIEDTGAPPWPLLIAGVLAALLVASGAGSSAYRWSRRRAQR